GSPVRSPLPRHARRPGPRRAGRSPHAGDRDARRCGPRLETARRRCRARGGGGSRSAGRPARGGSARDASPSTWSPGLPAERQAANVSAPAHVGYSTRVNRRRVLEAVLIVAPLLSCAAPASGETVVGRDARTAVALTVYSGQDLALVRESRRVDL